MISFSVIIQSHCLSATVFGFLKPVSKSETPVIKLLLIDFPIEFELVTEITIIKSRLLNFRLRFLVCD